MKTLPETITVNTLTKRLDHSDARNPQIKFQLEVSGPGGRMKTDYSGGILAFGVPNDFIWCEEGKMHKVAACIDKGQKTIYDERNYRKAVDVIYKAAKVNELDVINSLLLDSDAGQNAFSEFCEELGYDKDSRAAYKTWETCSEQGAEFRRIMRGQIEQLRELTSDL